MIVRETHLIFYYFCTQFDDRQFDIYERNPIKYNFCYLDEDTQITLLMGSKASVITN